jgi:hypothetical protein
MCLCVYVSMCLCVYVSMCVFDRVNKSPRLDRKPPKFLTVKKLVRIFVGAGLNSIFLVKFFVFSSSSSSFLFFPLLSSSARYLVLLMRHIDVTSKYTPLQQP